MREIATIIHEAVEQWEEQTKMQAKLTEGPSTEGLDATIEFKYNGNPQLGKIGDASKGNSEGKRHFLLGSPLAEP